MHADDVAAIRFGTTTAPLNLFLGHVGGNQSVGPPAGEAFKEQQHSIDHVLTVVGAACLVKLRGKIVVVKDKLFAKQLIENRDACTHSGRGVNVHHIKPAAKKYVHRNQK